MSLKKALLVLVVCFSYVNSAQLCYECDPSSEGNCIEPEKHNIRVMNCEAESEIAATSSPLEFECFTLIADTADNTTGLFRGCTSTFSGSSTTCEYLLDQYKKYNAIECKTCSADRCNTVFLPEPKIDDPAGDGSNGAIAEHSIKFSIIMISAVFLLTSILLN